MVIFHYNNSDGSIEMGIILSKSLAGELDKSEEHIKSIHINIKSYNLSLSRFISF